MDSGTDISSGRCSPHRRWPCLALADKVAHQVAGVTPPAPQDLVSSPSAWEAVGTNACPIVLCLATQCPPLHVGWGGIISSLCWWGDHPARARGRLPSTPHHSGTPRRPPRVLPALGPLDGCLPAGTQTALRHPVRGLHKHFLIKRQLSEVITGLQPQLWMSPEQSSHKGLASALGLVVNFPFGRHRPTGHPLA